MKNKVYPDFDSAVADMQDGMTFMSPGFGNVGLARNLLAAVHRLGVKELTGISNNAGSLDERVDVGTLHRGWTGQEDDLCLHSANAPVPDYPLRPDVQRWRA